MCIWMQLCIKPMCIHKSLFLQSFLTHFMESSHYQSSLFNLTTAKTFAGISVMMLCCKWNFHIHNFLRRPNNKAQPCRMFVQKGLTGGGFFESVNTWGRKVWQWRPLQRTAFPHTAGTWSFFCLWVLWVFFSIVRHSKRGNEGTKWSTGGWGGPGAQVSPLLWLLYHRAWQQPMAKLPKNCYLSHTYSATETVFQILPER